MLDFTYAEVIDVVLSSPCSCWSTILSGMEEDILLALAAISYIDCSSCLVMISNLALYLMSMLPIILHFYLP